MDDMLNLRPAPQRRDAGEEMRALREALGAMLASQRPLEAVATDPAADMAARLRLRLAVRSWVSPMDLLFDVPRDQLAAPLSEIAQEVELAERVRPGQWFMTLAARKRVVGSNPREALVAASASLHPHDADPLRLAFCLALELESAPTETQQRKLDGQSVAVLRELSRMASWAGRIQGMDRLAAAAGARLNRSRRDRELEGVDLAHIFGRDKELARIHNFLRLPPPTQGGVPTLYVNGIGGSGKSTLLMAAEKALRDSPDSALAVRLDFDSASLDPRSPALLDVQLLSALSVEEPRLAADLQRVVAQLKALADHRLRARLDATEADLPRTGRARGSRGVVKKSMHASKGGSEVERTQLNERYERISALQPLSGLPGFRDRGVVLFVDTLENVSRIGEDAINSVLEWLGSLRDFVPRGDLRLVLAARDALGSLEMRALSNRLDIHGLHLVANGELSLVDLDEVAACDMLQQRGMPASAAALAAEALPRNPLVLRLAADAWHAAAGDVTAIQSAYRDGRIDRATASGYLAQRVVQHVPRQPARRYAIAAMALESVTEKQLRDIVIPVVDGTDLGDRKLAAAVFHGLSDATWLTSEDKPGTLRWHTELRNLALPMIMADPLHASVNERVLSFAAVWNEQHRGSPQRALDHLQKATPWPLPEDLLVSVSSWTRPMARQLDAASGILEADEVETELHRLRLEGVGDNPGEGDRLVAQGRSPRALQMYRARPTREPGAPPTFVIRALALTGDWQDGEVESARVLAEVRRQFQARGGNLQRTMVERLHWLTRLELLRRDALEHDHVELLRDVCRTLKFRPQNGALLGLVGLAELQSRPSSQWIAPSSWPPPDTDLGPELRFTMVRTASRRLPSPHRRGRWVSTNLGAMLQFDQTWMRQLAELCSREIVEIAGGSSLVFEILSKMLSLSAAPFVETEQLVASCSQIRVRIDLSRVDPGQAPALLRGTTIEFHGPLAALLEGHTTLETLMRLVRGLPFSPGSVLTLSEFEVPNQPQNDRRLQAALPAVLMAVDRAGGLAHLCHQLLIAPEQLLVRDHGEAVSQRLSELAGRYLAWARTLSLVAEPPLS